MSRQRRKNRNRPGDESSEPLSYESFIPLIAAVSLFVAAGAAVYGMERLKKHVYALPEYNPPIRVELADPPDWVEREGWRDRILGCVQIPADQQWLDEALVRAIGDQINRSGWVSRVERITQSTDGTIRIACQFRRPIAMVRVSEGFVPVDREGVRLPTGSGTQLYDLVDDDSGWMKIEGVSTGLPEVGEAFGGDDALAAVKIASLIFQQEFALRISRIDVRNFRGRLNKRENHIRLLTRDGGEIKWGSAIGEEIEEASATDKIKTIMMYFRKGPPQAHVDISVFPNRWIEPAEPVIRTADGSRSRAR